jgi:hypothetical protein
MPYAVSICSDEQTAVMAAAASEVSWAMSLSHFAQAQLTVLLCFVIVPLEMFAGTTIQL